MKKCSFCGEEIQDVAIKCRFCGEMLNGAVKQFEAQSKCPIPTYKSPKILPKEHLLAGEEIYFETRPAWGMYFNLGILTLIAAIWWPMAIGVAVLFLICGLIGYTNAVYAITDKRIISMTGVFAKSYKQCPLAKVQNFELKTNIASIGGISFDTAGTTFKEIVWSLDNSDAKKIYKIISEILHK